MFSSSGSAGEGQILGLFLDPNERCFLLSLLHSDLDLSVIAAAICPHVRVPDTHVCAAMFHATAAPDSAMFRLH